MSAPERRRRGAPSALSVVLLTAALLIAGLPSAPVAGSPATPAGPAAAPPALGEVLAAFTTPEPPSPTTLAPLGLALIEHYPASGVSRLRAADGDVAAAVARLRAAGLVRFAEPNARLRVAELIPNDPGYPDQAPYWDLVGAPAAWEITTGSPGVVVALLDGAIDLDHPDLAGNIWTNPGEIPDNGLDDDANGYIDDVHGFDFVGDFAGDTVGVPGQDADPDVRPGDTAAGDGRDQDRDGVADGAVGHGTRVAGIIAARGNDGVGIAGVAWNVRIMPVRVMDPEGNGFFSSFISALDYAVANGAGVVNVSLTASVLSQAAQAAVAAAAGAGVVIVGAAGNSGADVAFPAALPQIIAVGAHGPLSTPNERADFSPRRPGVDLVAPGVTIPTTDVLAGSALPAYTTASGTSFSASFVTGTVALIRSWEPGADAARIRDLLRDTATDLPDAAWPDWDGAGRLNLGLALATIAGLPPFPPTIDGIDLVQKAYRIQGHARPGSNVALAQVDDGPLGNATADASGAYVVQIARDALPETQAHLTLVGVASKAGQTSAASPPAALALPYIVTLLPGWNLVPWVGATAPGDAVLADLPPAIERLYVWDGRDWQIGVPGNPLFRIPLISAGAGLWLYLTGADPVDWRQDRTPLAAPSLSPGWHLRAWTGPSALAADVAASPGLRIDALFAWDGAAAAHQGFFPQAPALGTLTFVPHLQPLWVHVGAGQGPWPSP